MHFLFSSGNSHTSQLTTCDWITETHLNSRWKHGFYVTRLVSSIVLYCVRYAGDSWIFHERWDVWDKVSNEKIKWKMVWWDYKGKYHEFSLKDLINWICYMLPCKEFNSQIDLNKTCSESTLKKKEKMTHSTVKALSKWTEWHSSTFFLPTEWTGHGQKGMTLTWIRSNESCQRVNILSKTLVLHVITCNRTEKVHCLHCWTSW